MNIETITLSSGAHERREQGMCVMEAAAYLSGEPHSDHPACVSPVMASFCRSWNDVLDQSARHRLLRPLLPLLIGTRTTDADEETRAWMATDWLARVHTPVWLRLAGKAKHAQALEACARIVDAATAQAALPTIAAASVAASTSLFQTVESLQLSAVELLRAMCAVGRQVEVDA